MPATAQASRPDTREPSPQRGRPRVALVIPTLNEEESIARVIQAVPRSHVDDIIVADSGSTDQTVERARAVGARVVMVARRGYGRACLAGAQAAHDCDIIVFLDGDGSDPPELIPSLLAPILSGAYDFVIGSRTRGDREPGSMSLHQIAAGYLAGALMRLFYGVAYTDMCAFRAIRREDLDRLAMREMTYGWNLEMQMRASRSGLRVLEIPVAHRRRTGGASKVSGSVMGTLKASLRIGLTFVRVALEPRGRAGLTDGREPSR
jgi:glycosyltransferase involved in cell wall biosynthesis